MSSTVSNEIRDAPPPVLVVSSRAGFGNYRAGEALLRQMTPTRPAEHLAVETLVEDRLARANFVRYRFICEQAPWLLHGMYRLALPYRMKRWAIGSGENQELGPLYRKLVQDGVQTVIATNHRAALWLGALKLKRKLSCKIWGCLTDYHFGAGWRHILWEGIDRFFGPIPPNQIPLSIRSRYRQIPLPVPDDPASLQTDPGDPNQVLLTGGGWGLGPLASSARWLHRSFRRIRIHVVCGDNRALFSRLQREYNGDARVCLYGAVPSLVPLLRSCRSVVCRPGALTITEAFLSRRTLFLLPGLPVVEESNASYAVRHFKAKHFHPRAFQEWYQQTSGPKTI